MAKKLFYLLLVIAVLGAGFFFLKKDNFGLFDSSSNPGKNASSKKTYKIGVIFTGGAYQQAIDGLKKGLEEKGLKEGQNVAYIIKDTRGNSEVLKPSIDEMLKENPDVIYSVSTPVTTQVSASVGNRIPIVFNIVGDPVGAGFIKSYSAPETNLTGCSNLSAELSGKRLEIFKEAFPNIKKVVTFYDPLNKFSQISIENTRKAAGILQIEMKEMLVKDKNDLARALASINPGDFDGIYITPDSMVVSNANLITAKSLELKIPAMGHEATLAAKGVSLTYGADFYQMGVQCSSVLSSVLSGQSPAKTPVLTPDKINVAVNLKNIGDIGATISDKVLKEADEVIR